MAAEQTFETLFAQFVNSGYVEIACKDHTASMKIESIIEMLALMIEKGRSEGMVYTRPPTSSCRSGIHHSLEECQEATHGLGIHLHQPSDTFDLVDYTEKHLQYCKGCLHYDDYSTVCALLSRFAHQSRMAAKYA